MILHYQRANNLSALHTELLAAIPALRLVMTVQGLGNDIWLTVPDTADQTAITTVVNAHVPPPPPRIVDYGGDVPPWDQVVDGVGQLRQFLGVATPTLAQTITVLKLLIRLVLFMCQRIVA